MRTMIYNDEERNETPAALAVAFTRKSRGVSCKIYRYVLLDGMPFRTFVEIIAGIEVYKVFAIRFNSLSTSS